MKNYAIYLFVFLMACESNEFDSVKPISAPPAGKGTTKIEAPNKAKGKSVIPKSGDLPSNHPSIGKGVMKTPKSTSKLPSDFGKSGGLLWSAPTSWQASPPSNSMRLAEYQIKGVKGSAPAVLAVYQLGGTVETNISRWIGQFRKDGKPVTDSKRKTQIIAGLNVHQVDVSGTYNSGMAGGNQPDQDSQRLLGAIVETKVGLYFLKLIGPSTIVDKEVQNFDAMMKSLKPGR